MSSRVFLNNVDHHDLRVRRGAEASHRVNQALVFPNEFEALQREYPILFRADPNGEMQAVALLGLDRDENLFLKEGDGEDGWHARAIPASLERGAFSIAVRDAAGSELMIQVDLDHPQISRTEGEPLFRPHGGNAPRLDHVAAVLRTIFTGAPLSAPMFAAFAEADLLETIAIDVELSQSQRYSIGGYLGIAVDRIAALRGSSLDRLHAGGFLSLALFAAASLANVQSLVDRKRAKLGAP